MQFGGMTKRAFVSGFSVMSAWALVALATAVPVSSQTTFDHARLARTALERHIRPGYERLAVATAGLAATLARACPALDRQRQGQIDRAFNGLIAAWGRVEHLQFGPIVEGNRLERFFFWPDRRGLGARQIAKVLAERDERVLNPDQLAERSVALQGIGALETVLFADPAAFRTPEQARHRCGYARAIATLLDRIAGQLVTAWAANGTYARHWSAPGLGNPHYLKPAETTFALAKAYDQGLERVRDLRIAGPLGLTADRRRLPIVLATSDRTFVLIVANIEGVLDLAERGGMVAGIVATGSTHPRIDVRVGSGSVLRNLTVARDAARKLERMRRVFQRPAAHDRLIAMGFPLKNARLEAKALLTLTAGLTIGFNASDGD